MLEMKWSWQTLESTPPYVRKYCVDLLSIRREAEAEHARRNRR